MSPQDENKLIALRRGLEFLGYKAEQIASQTTQLNELINHRLMERILKDNPLNHAAIFSDLKKFLTEKYSTDDVNKLLSEVSSGVMEEYVVTISEGLADENREEFFKIIESV